MGNQFPLDAELELKMDWRNVGPITSITKHKCVMQYNKRLNAQKLNVNKRTELRTFFLPYETHLTSTNYI